MSLISPAKFEIKNLGITDYATVFDAMQKFTDTRQKDTSDQLWLTEHKPVYTLGYQGERNQILNRNSIPVIQSDRGGHVTYHGPGQLVAYPLVDLRRQQLGVRAMVTLIEKLLIQLLNDYDIDAHARPDAPGVYVQEKKIASLGLRISKGCSYHGLALNVSMDLTPFLDINPCGMTGMQMTQMRDFTPNVDIAHVSAHLCKLFTNQFS